MSKKSENKKCYSLKIISTKISEETATAFDVLELAGIDAQFLKCIVCASFRRTIEDGYDIGFIEDGKIIIDADNFILPQEHNAFIEHLGEEFDEVLELLHIDEEETEDGEIVDADEEEAGYYYRLPYERRKRLHKASISEWEAEEQNRKEE